ncbi:ADP-ribosylglycohydrolase family protein [Gephyromycinifex aptenodytis]|uniref:ADP-ribosylglycohydrolase family protein n=1 Tax=Gephyromycinifex aptenodytis TaxID=2716227 RepID=UPI001D0213AE|nr:ADP-ribosylglycohydrolase family protein [Gephyromycinifex aptenodytis]
MTQNAAATTDPSAMRRRALGALYGLAIGDALGMPTQDLTQEQIRDDYGRIAAFLPAGPHQIIAACQPAGTVTDDTEQMILVATMLAQTGSIAALPFARALAEWEDSMRERGSLDLLGPSTRAAIASIRAGASAEESGKNGTTNGAAMRIAPVGVANPPEALDELVDRVVEACGVTHNTSLGISSAAAVAAAVSAGVSGASRSAAVELGIEAAEIGALRGHQVPGPSIAARARLAVDWLPSVPDPARAIYDVIGTTVASQESVVAALAICASIGDPWEAVCLAAGVGGDTDTVAAIVGAICGATNGIEAFPENAVATIQSVNDIHLEDVVDKLLQLRLSTATSRRA